MAKMAAEFDMPVLLLGKTGTGKELFARAIHEMSKRSERDIVIVNAARLNPTIADSELFGYVKGAFTGAYINKAGLFQKANKGTIFLDEIGNLPLEIQRNLFRAIEYGEVSQIGSSVSGYVDIRIITATNKNLKRAVESGEFEEPLFARLNKYPIILPPLKERIEDIPDLANKFVKSYKGEKDISGISEEAIEYLCDYDWPRNVRQLMTVIERVIINTKNSIIQIDDIRFAMEQDKYDEDSQEVEVKSDVKINTEEENISQKTFNKKEIKEGIKPENDNNSRLIEKLRETQFNINETAILLNIGRNTVTYHFQGICFKYLVEYDKNIKEIALAISGNSHISYKLEKKISLYHENLISKIKECKNIETAKEKCRILYKNIPNEYSNFIEKIIEDYFKQL